eukprot:scaffold28236_cov59-Phaeocystis_antarctica.AAC.4
MRGRGLPGGEFSGSPTSSGQIVSPSVRYAPSVRKANAVVKPPKARPVAPISLATSATETGQNSSTYIAIASALYRPSCMRSCGVRPSKKVAKVQPPRTSSFSCTMHTLMALPSSRAKRSSSASLSPASPTYVWSLRYSRRCVAAAFLPSSERRDAGSLVTTNLPSIPDARSFATSRAPGLLAEANITRPGRSVTFWRASSPGMYKPRPRWSASSLQPSSSCSASSLRLTRWNQAIRCHGMTLRPSKMGSRSSSGHSPSLIVSRGM